MMGEEELDRARAEEARRICGQLNENPVTLAARLAREGWMPPDPLIDEVELVYRHVPVGSWATAAGTKDGIRFALERGIEIGKAT